MNRNRERQHRLTCGRRSPSPHPTLLPVWGALPSSDWRGFPHVRFRFTIRAPMLKAARSAVRNRREYRLRPLRRRTVRNWRPTIEGHCGIALGSPRVPNRKLRRPPYIDARGPSRLSAWEPNCLRRPTISSSRARSITQPIANETRTKVPNEKPRSPGGRRPGLDATRCSAAGPKYSGPPASELRREAPHFCRQGRGWKIGRVAWQGEQTAHGTRRRPVRRTRRARRIRNHGRNFGDCATPGYASRTMMLWPATRRGINSDRRRNKRARNTGSRSSTHGRRLRPQPQVGIR